MNHVRVRLTLLALAASVIVASCGQPPETAEETGPRVQAEGYLFDAVLRRDGKPTSFRLELLHADSVMSLAGRGYLGKSGLKGRATRDSLIVFFPTEDQYVSEPIADLLFSLECGIKPTNLNILDLFRQRPDSLRFDSSISVISNPSDPEKPSFLVFIANCPWQIELSYDLQNDLAWRVRQFSFYDGKRTHLEATRREFKSRVLAKPSKFIVAIPTKAERIVP